MHLTLANVLDPEMLCSCFCDHEICVCVYSDVWVLVVSGLAGRVLASFIPNLHPT